MIKDCLQETKRDYEKSIQQNIANIKEKNINQISEIPNPSICGQDKQIFQKTSLYPRMINKKNINGQNEDKLIEPFLNKTSNQTQSYFELIAKNFSIFKELSKEFKITTYTQEQITKIAHVLVEGIISLERQQTAEEKQIVEQIFNEENTNLIRNEQLFFYGMLDKLKQLKIQPTPNSKSRIYHRIANIRKDTQIKQEWQNQYGIKCIKSNDYQVLSEAELEQIVKYQAIADKIKQMGNKISYRSILQFNKEDAIINGGIKQYFESGSAIRKSFQRIFLEILAEKEKLIEKISVVIDPKLQSLMLCLFSIQTIRGKSLGKVIYISLKNEDNSRKLKSVLLSRFFEVFQLPKESDLIKYLSTQKANINKKIFRQQFFKEYYQIQDAFQYATENYRLFQRILQLQQILFYRNMITYKIQLSTKFAVNLVLEQHCLQNILSLAEIFKLYSSLRRNKYDILYDQFSYYYSWINSQLQQNKMIDKHQLLQSQISIIKAQQLLQNGNITSVSSMLKKARIVFKSERKYKEYIECSILLTEYLIKTSNNSLENSIRKFEQEVIQKAQTLGLQVQGPLLADALWRISEFFLPFVKGDERQQLLQTFTKMAISHMSRSKGYQFINALSQIENQYAPNIDWDDVILMNQKLEYIKLYNLEAEGCKYLAKAKWNKLIKLDLGKNIIGDDGCDYLKKANWKNLTCLNLQLNEIGHNGCLHLSEANWKNLTRIDLSYNNIGGDGCQNLIKADWKNLTSLYLRSCNIGAEGCQHLSNGDWKNLTHLILSQNDLRSEGCQYLSNAQWTQLTHLQIPNNEISDTGCMHLSNANWKRLVKLNISQNQISANGCAYLRNADWKHLTKLNLLQNGIRDEGSMHLSKANWKHLTKLNLKSNGIGDEGFMHLSRANWKNLQQLDLTVNQIECDGIVYQSNTDWRNLKKLSLSLNRIPKRGFMLLCQAKWMNLTHLDLNSNKIRAEGCLYLSRANWKKLTQLDLGYNYFGDEGCEYLTKADWKYLNQLYLASNSIGANGCLYLSKAEWRNLTHLNLEYNKFGADGCEHLSKAHFNLTHLQLKNEIGPGGCLHLSKAVWKNLTKINLWGNNIGNDSCKGFNEIGAEGFQHLSSGKWAKLIQLSSQHNKINAEAFMNISKAKWRNIQKLVLQKNDIGADGCAYLSMIDWRSIQQLDLRGNNIGDDGCQHLIKANLGKLFRLKLSTNNIGAYGCAHLSKASWNNLDQLHIGQNRVGFEGYVILGKAGWNKITYLNFGEQMINQIYEKPHLIRFAQKSIRIDF